MANVDDLGESLGYVWQTAATEHLRQLVYS